jgi:signal transduction histidine kinase/FixJ family two-component response regulator
MSTGTPRGVLVVDDDADTRANLCDILELDDYQVETAGSAAEALARNSWASLVAILLDRRLPDGNAEDLLPQLRHLAPRAAVLVVTGYHDLEGAIAALRQGAADYILKPINSEALRASLARLAEQRRTAEEIERLNKDLKQHVHELQTLLDVIPIGIAIAQDPACRNIRINPSFARLIHVEPQARLSLGDLHGPWPDLKVYRDGKELPRHELPLLQAARDGKEVRGSEVQMELPDGHRIDLLISAAPLFNDQGQPRGAIGALIDITDRKRAQERALQTERLAAIGQMMTGLAHESGNALARSQACLEMLALEVPDRPEALDMIARIQKAQDHLRQLYDEVRGYAAPLKLQREPRDVSAVWRQAWNNLALLRKGRQAELHEETAGVDLHCPVDAFRLEQVFRNILENSLAACRDAVVITVRCSEASLFGQPALRVAVADNGPGLSPEQRERIFEPFFTTKTKGTGLGMAIAKRILEAHGGQIAVGSHAGPGAEIVLTLPREAS